MRHEEKCLLGFSGLEACFGKCMFIKFNERRRLKRNSNLEWTIATLGNLVIFPDVLGSKCPRYYIWPLTTVKPFTLHIAIIVCCASCSFNLNHRCKTKQTRNVGECPT